MKRKETPKRGEGNWEKDSSCKKNAFADPSVKKRRSLRPTVTSLSGRDMLASGQSEYYSTWRCSHTAPGPRGRRSVTSGLGIKCGSKYDMEVIPRVVCSTNVGEG